MCILILLKTRILNLLFWSSELSSILTTNSNFDKNEFWNWTCIFRLFEIEHANKNHTECKYLNPTPHLPFFASFFCILFFEILFSIFILHIYFSSLMPKWSPQDSPVPKKCTAGKFCHFHLRIWLGLKKKIPELFLLVFVLTNDAKKRYSLSNFVRRRIIYYHIKQCVVHEFPL